MNIIKILCNTLLIVVFYNNFFTFIFIYIYSVYCNKKVTRLNIYYIFSSLSISDIININLNDYNL